MSAAEVNREDPVERQLRIRNFSIILGIAVAFVAVFPAIVAWLGRPPASLYLGYQYNTDDHMVYSAWMRQAMQGQFFFDNRFTTDAQPGLTVHLYFFILGQLSRIVGLTFAAGLGRFIFTFLFVLALGRLVAKLDLSTFVSKLAISTAVFGGGFGFLVFQSFGVNIVPGTNGWFAAMSEGRLPIDVWQPEAFVFPSMLTNGLFMVSLWLMISILNLALEARESWKPVLPGFIAIGILMNIHSYDVLTLAVVLVGLLISAVTSRQFSLIWLVRVAVLAAGVTPAALWFQHVLQVDPVFQARAATETFSPNFRIVLLGYAPLLALALYGLWNRRKDDTPFKFGLIVWSMALLVGFFVAGGRPDGYFLGQPAWIGLAVASLALIALMADRNNIAMGLILGWAILGLAIPYFPALYQRKLMMGLSIPFGILAAIGLGEILGSVERGSRNLVASFAILLLSATSLRWFFREFNLLRTNVSNTTVHPVYLSRDVGNIVDYLNALPWGRHVVISMPGIQLPTEDKDRFQSPYLPDLNPILSGLTGVYTYAGHWSETPNYGKRRNEVIQKVFNPQSSPDTRKAFLRSVAAEFLVVPKKEVFPELQLSGIDQLGDVVVNGLQFDLVRLYP